MRSLNSSLGSVAALFLAITVTLSIQGSVAAQTERIVYTFQGDSDGAYPYAGLVAGPLGALYGTTYRGGTTCDCGTVFKLIPAADGSWTKATLYSFQGGSSDGAYPYGGVVIDSKGNLFGTTQGGGGSGVVFELSPPLTMGGRWTESLLHVFTGGTDGGGLTAAPILDQAGNLYGITWFGGPLGQGTVYQLSPGSNGVWTLTNLYAFGGPSDGFNPAGRLLFDNTGNLYGTTAYGGVSQQGTVFRLQKPASSDGTWGETVLYSFAGGNDGAVPYASVTFDRAGNLYGTTTSNPLGNGTVFQLSPPKREGQWTESVLYNFAGQSDGSQPFAGVGLDKAGNLYGVTSDYESGGNGTLFRLSPPSLPGAQWTENTLHAFTSGADGSEPFVATPVLLHGVLYGTTWLGGSFGFGTIYAVTP